MAFKFNINASYQPGQQDPPSIDVGNLARAQIQIQADDPSKLFRARYPDIFNPYCLPHVTSNNVVQNWNSNPMQFWQNQLNFATWCATTGCGISLVDHLMHDDALVQAVYRFHAYYQIRRILKEIQASLPEDVEQDVINNPYNHREYERICNEFNISPQTNWRVKGHNNGLGRVYNYWTGTGYRPVMEEYDPSKMSFTKMGPILHIDYIKQDAAGADKAWRTFIINRSYGFTRAGVERLNDSIRTYVWAILGAQSQTRTAILGYGTAFDAQKQYLANVDDAISSPVDLPSAINRYQDVLQYARSEVNFSFGTGLYMAPGNMLLRVGNVVGYNNLIVIATEKQKLGLNKTLNADKAPPIGDTGETGLVKPNNTPSSSTSSTSSTSYRSTHEDEKTALIVGVIVASSIAFWIFD